MTIKAKCYQLAKQHNLAIDIHKSGKCDYHYSVNLPEGYQIDKYDDRTGLCASAESMAEMWKGIYGDLLEIIPSEPFFPISKETK